MNDDKVLTLLCDRFKINLDEAKLEMKKFNEKILLEKHKYKIWQGKNGSWYTHLPPDRKLLRKSSHEKLIDSLQTFYHEEELSPTIRQVFDAWLMDKLTKREIQQGSADRYQTDFVRFFVDSGFADRKIKNVSESDLETFIRGQIAAHRLSQKTFAGLRILIRGTWKKAKKDGYTNLSITEFMGDLDLSRNIFSKKIIERENEVFSEEELPSLTLYLNREDASIWDLGIALTLETGLRVGELSALQRADWNGGYTLKVRRSDVQILWMQFRFREKSKRFRIF